MLKESILNIEVSCFKNYWEEKNPRNVNLLTWLTSTKYKDEVEAIRSIDDPEKRKKLKQKLPAITPSGIFKHRIKEVPLEEKLIRHTGLVQIDIDLTPKNKLISNWEDLKSELIKLPQIAYLGKSVSGLGYWGLIPIPPDPEGHKFYFDSLKEIFLKRWGIELDDKPKNVVSLRGYSFDAEAYFNHHAKTFLIKKLPQPKQFQTVKNTGIKASGLGDWIIKKLEASQEGQRHGDRLKLARFAGGLVAGGYLDLQICESLIQSYLSQYVHIDSHHTQAKEIKAIQDGFNDGLKAPIQLEDHQKPNFEKYQSVFVAPQKVETDQITSKDSNPDYISQLYFENGLLMNGDGYPAEWDLFGSYTDKKTKDFIRMAVKNPLLIKFREKFVLS